MRRHFLKSSDVAEILKQKSKKGKKVKMSRENKKGRKNETTPPT
jgi:hypothetical protein